MKTREDAIQKIGETLLIIQKVERFLAAILVTMAGDAERQLQRLLLKDKQTLGRLIQYLNKVASVPPDAQAALRRFLDYRNTFVHNLMMQSWFDLDSKSGRKKVDRFTRALLGDARIVLMFALATLQKIRSQSTLNREQGDYIDRITSRIIDTAYPDFGGLTETEYVDKVLAEARACFP